MLNVKELSILHLCETSNHRCGYCRAEKGSYTYGLWAESLKVDDYQDLIDLGWRRAGHYIYKPVMDKTCCPQYTIRCEALCFQLTKSQKKVLKRFNHHLSEDQLPKAKVKLTEEDPDQPDAESASCILQDMPEVPVNLKKHLFEKQDMSGATNAGTLKQEGSLIQEQIKSVVSKKTIIDKNVPSDALKTEQDLPVTESAKILVTELLPIAAKCLPESHDQLPVANVPEKNANMPPGKPHECFVGFQDQLESVSVSNIDQEMTSLVKPMENPQELVSSSDNKMLPAMQTEVLVEPHNSQTCLGIVRKGRGADTSLPQCRKAKLVRQEKYANKSKGGMAPKNVRKSLKDFFQKAENVTHEFKTKLVKLNSADYKDSSDIVYALYKKYQMTVHSEAESELSKTDFERFLVKTPLIYTDIYGSYHMQYWWDSKLIAVGVIDILPFCVSSVYFFYDPDFRFLTLGTYSSLREIHYVQELHESYPKLQYYYMGYFITSCVKMRYKGNLHPSSLLCPETRNWVALDQELISRLMVTKYLRLYTGTSGPGRSGSHIEESSVKDLKKVFRQMKVISRRNIFTVDEYLTRRVNIHESKYNFMMDVLPVLLNTRLIMSIYLVLD